MKKVQIRPGATLFLDRDGVINYRLKNDYVKTPAEFKFLPGVLEIMPFLTTVFSKIIIVTNQQGIGKGLMGEEDLRKIHHKMSEEISKAGGRVDAVLHCPHLASENSDCRKPATGMADTAKKMFPAIDFANAVMVGDSISDMTFGSRKGMTNILVEPATDEFEPVKNENLPAGTHINSRIVRLFDLRHLLKVTRQNISSASPWEDLVGYSRAVRIGNIVEVAGTTAVDGDQIIGENDAYAQTVFILQKIEMALLQAGATLRDVIRTRIYVTDISDWEAVGKAHGVYFKDVKPAATMVEVKKLIDPKLLIEIEASAVIDEP